MILVLHKSFYRLLNFKDEPLMICRLCHCPRSKVKTYVTVTNVTVTLYLYTPQYINYMLLFQLPLHGYVKRIIATCDHTFSTQCADHPLTLFVFGRMLTASCADTNLRYFNAEGRRGEKDVNSQLCGH
jgi:hypothetical protein